MLPEIRKTKSLDELIESLERKVKATPTNIKEWDWKSKKLPPEIGLEMLKLCRDKGLTNEERGDNLQKFTAEFLQKQ